LVDLDVGEIPLREESVSTIALTLAHIFPRIEAICYVDENWEKVVGAMYNSREIIKRSSEEHPFLHPGVTLVTLPQEPHLETLSDQEMSRSTREFQLYPYRYPPSSSSLSRLSHVVSSFAW